MACWKFFVGSLCFSTTAVFLSYFFYDAGGWYFAEPGLGIKLFCQDFILLTIPTGDYYFTFPRYTEVVFNLVFYTGLVFTLLKILKIACLSRKNNIK